MWHLGNCIEIVVWGQMRLGMWLRCGLRPVWVEIRFAICHLLWACWVYSVSVDTICNILLWLSQPPITGLEQIPMRLTETSLLRIAELRIAPTHLLHADLPKVLLNDRLLLWEHRLRSSIVGLLFLVEWRWLIRGSAVVKVLLDCVGDSRRYPFYLVSACSAEWGVSILDGAICEIIVNWLCEFSLLGFGHVLLDQGGAPPCGVVEVSDMLSFGGILSRATQTKVISRLRRLVQRHHEDVRLIPWSTLLLSECQSRCLSLCWHFIPIWMFPCIYMYMVIRFWCL